jgi:subtilase family serine protease
MQGWRRALLVSVAGVVLVVAMAGTGSAASLPRTVRLGQAQVIPTGSRLVSALAADTTLHVSVALKSRDPQALSRYAQAVSDPSSPDYRHYLTVAQFAQRFGASPAAQQSVLASLRAHGLRPGALSANDLTVPVTATAATVANAFSVALSRFRVPALGTQAAHTAYAANRAPALDANIAGDVQAVIGLNDLATPQPLMVPPHRTAASTTRSVAPAQEHPHTVAATPCAAATQAAASQGAYTDNQIDDAYGLNGLYAAGDYGAGQTVALYELEPNLPTDISAFQSCFGTDTTVNYTGVDGGAGTGTGVGEATLDIETIIAAAPAVTIDVYNGMQTGSTPYDIYNQIISNNTAQVISTSWGTCEKDLDSTELQAEASLFQEAAIQGQSLFAAAGDDGSEDCDGSDFDTTDLAVDDPGSQPYVTSVGGARLISTVPSETAWNDEEGAGGGGISSVWGMPSYQSTAPASLNVINSHSSGAPCAATSGDCREVPDVSADADPETGYETYYTDTTGDPPWTAEGGTSAAAPFWAGLMALVNASSSCAGKAVGFANPALYAAANSAYSTDFSDITAGDNDFTAANGGLYPAGAGYDMATGLGSPLAVPLAATLCSESVSIANPGSQTETDGSAISPLQISASGAAGQSFSYSASTLPAGLAISPGGMITGTPTATTATPTTVTVTATSTGGFIGTTTFTINVIPTSVTVNSPGTRTATKGKKITPLTITATDSGSGETLTYSATKLPFGLSISTAGTISGTPKKTGDYHVTVTAKDLTGTTATTSFIYKIVAPKLTATVKLLGVDRAVRDRKLVFSVSADGGKRIREVVITLPGSVTLEKGARAISHFRGGRGRRGSISRHEIVVKLTGAKQVTVTVSGRYVRYSKALARDVHRRKRTKVVLHEKITRTNRAVTRLKFTIRFK